MQLGLMALTPLFPNEKCGKAGNKSSTTPFLITCAATSGSTPPTYTGLFVVHLVIYVYFIIALASISRDPLCSPRSKA